MRKPATVFSFLLVMMAILAVGYVTLPFVLAWGVRTYLADIGFADADLRIQRIGLASADVVDFTLGPGTKIGAERIRLEYSLGRLAGGVLDGLRVDGGRFKLGVGAAGLDLGPLDSIFAGDEIKASSSPAGVRLIGPLKITDARLMVATPLGEVAVALSGEALLTDALGTTINGAFAVAHPSASVEGRLSAVFDVTSNLSLDIKIANATSRADVAFTAMIGDVDVQGRWPDTLTGHAQVTANGVRVNDVPLGSVDLQARINGLAADTYVLVGGDGTGVLASLNAHTLDVSDPRAPLTIRGELASDGLRGPLYNDAGVDVVGALTFMLQGARTDLQGLAKNLDSGVLRADGPVIGFFAADLLQVDVPADDVSVTVDGRVTLDAGVQGWRLDAASSINVDLVQGGQRLKATLDGREGTALVSGGVGTDAPLLLASAFEASLLGVLSAPLALSGDAGGAVWVGTAEGIQFEDMALRFNPMAFKLDALDIVVDDFGARLKGPLSALSIRLSTDTLISGVLAGVEVNGGRVAGDARLNMDASGVRLMADGCMELAAASLRIGDIAVRPGPATLCAGSGGVPIIEAVRADGAVTTFRMGAALQSVEATIDGISTVALDIRLPRIEGAGTYDLLAGEWTGGGTFVGGVANFAESGFVVSGVDGSLQADGKATGVGVAFTLDTVDIADMRQPTRVAPMVLRGQGGLADDAATFDGTLTLGGGPMVKMVANHELTTGIGKIEAMLAHWNLAAAPGLTRLFPPLAGHFVDIIGDVDIAANAAWGPDQLTTSATIALAGVGFGSEPAEVAGIEGAFTLSDLVNLKTDGVQTLKIGFLDPGLPLLNGTVRFSLPGDQTVQLDEAYWPLTGGVLRIRDFSVPFDGAPTKVVAEVEGLDLAELAKHIDIDGLSAEGRLTGRIPVRFTPEGLVIDDARLRATEGGAIRYQSSIAVETLEASGQGAEILAQALEDFRFRVLEISMNGPLTGQIVAGAEIKGANPALYDGKAVELNVRLEGALRELLQSASVMNDLPDAIRDRVQGPSGVQ